MKQYSFIQESKISELVKDPEWQALRSSLVGTWKTYPERNCQLLRNYLDNLSECSIEKLRIVMNYLTGSGFRMGIIKHPCISQLRKDISVEMKRRKNQATKKIK